MLVRPFVASLLAFACACNSPPKNSCAASSNGITASASPTSTCSGLCVDAGTEGLICVVDCTDGGDAVCGIGTACASGEPLSPRSFCLPRCAGDAGAISCPGPLTCGDAGVCVP